MVRAPALAEKPTVLRRLPVSVDHSEGSRARRRPRMQDEAADGRRVGGSVEVARLPLAGEPREEDRTERDAERGDDLEERVLAHSEPERVERDDLHQSGDDHRHRAPAKATGSGLFPWDTSLVILIARKTPVNPTTRAPGCHVHM